MTSYLISNDLVSLSVATLVGFRGLLLTNSYLADPDNHSENFKREKVIILYPLDNTIYGYTGPRGRDGEAGAGGRGGGGREGEDQELRSPGG